MPRPPARPPAPAMRLACVHPCAAAARCPLRTVRLRTTRRPHLRRHGRPKGHAALEGALRAPHAVSAPRGLGAGRARAAHQRAGLSRPWQGGHTKESEGLEGLD